MEDQVQKQIEVSINTLQAALPGCSFVRVLKTWEDFASEVASSVAVQAEVILLSSASVCLADCLTCCLMYERQRKTSDTCSLDLPQMLRDLSHATIGALVLFACKIALSVHYSVANTIPFSSEIWTTFCTIFARHETLESSKSYHGLPERDKKPPSARDFTLVRQALIAISMYLCDTSTPLSIPPEKQPFERWTNSERKMCYYITKRLHMKPSAVIPMKLLESQCFSWMLPCVYNLKSQRVHKRN